MSHAARLALVALVGCASRAPTPSQTPARAAPPSDVPAVSDVPAAQGDASPAGPLRGVVSLGLDYSSGCGILADGRAICWAGDANLWAPPGEVDSDLVAPVGAFFVPDFQGVEELCLTMRMLCARLRGGEVRCRGMVNVEPDADGHSPQGVSVGTVADVPQGSTLRQVGGQCALTHPDGARAQVALPSGLTGAWREEPLSSAVRDCELRDGSPRCTGSNDGELLANAAAPRITREAPSSLFGLRGVREVAFSGRHGCAVLAEGGVRCWGRNLSGQLGTGDARSRAVPVPVPGLEDVRALRLIDEMSCAIRASGEVWCWGTSNTGLFAVDGVTSRLTPAAIPGLTEVTDLALTRSAACALKRDGTVWCWGRDGWSAGGSRPPAWQIRPVSIAP